MKNILKIFGINAALALSLAACGDKEDIIPEKPIDKPIDKPEPGVVKPDTVRMDLKTVADFTAFQKRAAIGAKTDTTYIASVRDFVPADSIDLSNTLKTQHKNKTKKYVTNWNEYGIVPSRDSIRITATDHNAAGSVVLSKNKSGQSFYAATKQDSVKLDAKGYKLRVLDPSDNQSAGVFKIEDLSDLSGKSGAIENAANSGKQVLVNIAGKIYVTDASVADLKKLVHQNIRFEKADGAFVAPADSKVTIDGEVLAKLYDANIIQPNVPKYFFVPAQMNLGAMQDKGLVVRTDESNGTKELSWAIPDVLNLGGKINAEELEVLSNYYGTITVRGDTYLENVSDESMGMFTSPAAPNSGTPLVFSQDPVILSTNNLTAANDSVGNMSIQKMRASFYKQNPGFKYHGIDEYYWWKDNSNDVAAENAIRPTRKSNNDIKINWYKGSEFIDTGWMTEYNGLVYVSIYNFEKLAFFFGYSNVSVERGGKPSSDGNMINNNSETLILTSNDDNILWLNGILSMEDRERKVKGKFPGCIQLDGKFNYNTFSWAEYFNKKIRTL